MKRTNRVLFGVEGFSDDQIVAVASLCEGKLVQYWSLAAALALRPLAFAAMLDQAAPVAKTNAGAVSGYWSRKVMAFKGIPYGADTQSTRFQAPEAGGGLELT